MIVSTDAPELRLQLRYEGPDVDRGRMSAVELGPVIFAIGDAVGRTSRLLYGDEKRIQLEVRADFEHGSFGIEFFAVSPTAQLVPPLSLDDLARIATILGLVGGVPGMIGFVRWLARRKIERIEESGDSYVVHVEGDSVVLSVTDFKVFTDPVIRKDMTALVAPLEEDRVTGLEIRAGDSDPVHVTSSERDDFDIKGLPGEDISEEKSVQVLEVLSPSFQRDNKWYFAQGEAKYYATIEDEDFLARVEGREERFGKDDALRVEMVVDVTRDEAGKLRFDRRITRVLEHLRATEGDQHELI